MSSPNRRIPLVAAAAAVALAAGLFWFAGGRSGEVQRASARRPAPLELPGFDPAQAPERLALLVGVDRYAPDSGLPDLDGSVNDVRAVREMLVARFDFAPADVLVLENEQATHEGLVGAFRDWLLARAGPGTEVVFWFSGHGSRVPDADGEEPDGWDETLLCWDSRSEGRRGSYDLVDDELTALLAALGQRTSRATVVTDCCYSGSVLRGDPRAAPKVRFAGTGDEPFERSAVEGFWPADVPLGSDEEIDQRAYVHVAACGPDQLAHEIRDSGEGEGAHGALSFFLLQALQGARPDLTYRQLVDEAAVLVASSFPGQTVWYEGTLERNVFSGRFSPQPAGFPARLRSDGRLEIRVGPWSGLRAGSELSVHDARTFDPAGTAVVDSISVARARATFTPLEGVPAPEGALRAIEVRRPDGMEPLVVFVQDGALAERLADVELCRVVRAPQPGCYRATVEDGRFALRTPEGLRVWLEETTAPAAPSERLEAARAGLAVCFADEHQYRALQLIARIPAQIPVEARFREATDEDRGRYAETLPWRDPGLRRVEGAAGGGYVARGGPEGGERFVVLLEIQNPGVEPFHALVFSVAEDRSWHPIWPHPGGGPDQSLVPPGGVRAAPVALLWNENWDRDRPMRDRYVVLAARTAPDVSTFRKHAATLRGGVPPPAPEVSSGLWAGIGRLAFPERHRGAGGGVDLDPATLGIAVVDLLVERAPPGE